VIWPWIKNNPRKALKVLASAVIDVVLVAASPAGCGWSVLVVLVGLEICVYLEYRRKEE
jgi:hypothetical protein